jgi:molecular chaperone GrpE (heat shock protein)
MRRRPANRWSHTTLGPPEEVPGEQPAPDASASDGAAPEHNGEAALSMVDNRLQGLGAELRDLRALFEERLKYDEVREGHFSRLYGELEDYKRDEAGERLLGLARSVILVVDKLEQEDHERLTWVAEELQECLLTAGIERIDTPSEAVGPREEQVVGFLDDDASEDRQVLGAGYRYGERVVRPRRVMIRRDDSDRAGNDTR